VGEAGGDKKRRDVVKSIVHVPKYDFYIIASQKGIICQWSSRVQHFKLVFSSFLLLEQLLEILWQESVCTLF